MADLVGETPDAIEPDVGLLDFLQQRHGRLRWDQLVFPPVEEFEFRIEGWIGSLLLPTRATVSVADLGGDTMIEIVFPPTSNQYLLPDAPPPNPRGCLAFCLN